jgi:hypothetical protein
MILGVSGLWSPYNFSRMERAALNFLLVKNAIFLMFIFFQERSQPNREKIVALCKMRGLIRDEVDEKNELSETRLISAAAEGKSMAELKLLVKAGAAVNGARPDGVTAIWLAAQVCGLLLGRIEVLLRSAEPVSSLAKVLPLSTCGCKSKKSCRCQLVGVNP